MRGGGAAGAGRRLKERRRLFYERLLFVGEDFGIYRFYEVIG